MVPNKAFIYKAVPNGWPVPGQDLAVEDIGFDENAVLPKGGFTTKNLYASFDPSQRRRMRDPSLKSYSPALSTGKPVISVSVLGRVLKSNNSTIKEVSMVLMTDHYIESYSAVEETVVASGRIKIIEEKPGVPLTAYLNLLGITGMTAYGSLHEIGTPKKGDTILISAAAGAVGQAVGQIALREGLNVIGSVGSDNKLNFILKDLCFTSGFNYRTEDLHKALTRLAPNGIDIYYDNVGGELLDIAITHMNNFGRIIACGSISTYNSESIADDYGLKNYSQVVRRRLRWQGFLVHDDNILRWARERDENVSKWIVDGSFKTVDYITDGIDHAVDGFLGMLKGKNLGKSILKIPGPE